MARAASGPVDRQALFDGRDVTQLAARAGVGLVLIAVGWYQAGDRLLLDDQRPWLALAAGGLVIGCVSGALWIMQLRRAVSIRAADLRRDASRLIAAEIRWRPGTDEAGDALVATTVDGAQFFHRPDCVLVSSRDVRAATEDEHRRDGRVACETCLDGDTIVAAGTSDG